MKLKGLKAAISMVRLLNDGIIYYNGNKGEFFVTRHEIFYPYVGLYCISQMMKEQGYRFDGTMKGLKDFMEANEHYFNKKGGE